MQGLSKLLLGVLCICVMSISREYFVEAQQNRTARLIGEFSVDTPIMVQLSTDGTHLYYASGNQISRYSLETETIEDIDHEVLDGTIQYFQLNNDENLIAYNYQETEQIYLYNIALNTTSLVFDHQEYENNSVSKIMFDPESAKLASIGETVIVVYDLETESIITHHQFAAPIINTEFIDDTHLIVFSNDGLFSWNIHSSNVENYLTCDCESVSEIAFDLDRMEIISFATPAFFTVFPIENNPPGEAWQTSEFAHIELSNLNRFKQDLIFFADWDVITYLDTQNNKSIPIFNLDGNVVANTILALELIEYEEVIVVNWNKRSDTIEIWNLGTIDEILGNIEI